MIKNAYLIGRPFGIPLKVHISLAVVLLFLLLKAPNGLLLVFLLGFSVVLHELGHSLVAIRKGGRVQEIVLYPIGGMARISHLPANPKDEFLIAAAGPAVSLLLTLCGGLLAVGWASLGSAMLMLFFVNLAAINLILALFNLIPAFPMDGGRILRAWLTRRKGRVEATRVAARTGRIFAVVFGLIGLFTGRFMLVLIALFIYFAAGGEYRSVLIQEGMTGMPFDSFFRNARRNGEPLDVQVSPPPYRHVRSRGTPLLKRLDEWLDRLFNP